MPEGSPTRHRGIAASRHRGIAASRHRDAIPRPILKMIGITDVTFVAAGNAKAVDLGEIGRDAFLDEFDRAIQARAA